MNNEECCPRCGLDLLPKEPKKGEVWLDIETGLLYRIRSEFERKPSGYCGTAVRVRPYGPQGCDPSHMIGVWPKDVQEGRLVHVKNPHPQDLLEEESGNDLPHPSEGIGIVPLAIAFLVTLSEDQKQSPEYEALVAAINDEGPRVYPCDGREEG